MKKRLFIILTLTLCMMSCVSTVESKAISCGSNLSSKEILDLIVKKKDCLDCLLVTVNEELKNCPTDVALNRVGMGVSIRMKKDGNDVLKYYESMPSTELLAPDEFVVVAYYYDMQSDYKNSLISYEKALQLDDNPFVRFSLAEVEFKAGRNAEVIKTLKRLVEMTYPLPKTSNLGFSYGAEDSLFDDASIFLAEMYQLANQQSEAEIVYRNLLSAYKTDDFHYPDYLLMFAELLAKSPNPDKRKESVLLNERAEKIFSNENLETRQLRKEMGKTWLRLPSNLLKVERL